MVFIFCLIIFGFIAFAASNTGAKFFDKLNEKNWEREMTEINPNFPAEMKRHEEERAAQIQLLKNAPEVLFAYSEYLESLKSKRRVKKVLSLEEFIERNFL